MKEQKEDFSRFSVQCVDCLTEDSKHYLSVYLADIGTQSQKALQRLRNNISTVKSHNKLVDAGKLSGPRQLVPLRCSFCLEPLYIRTATNGIEQYAIHGPVLNDEAPNCPQRSETTIPAWVLRALQHQGIQEGERHYRLKHSLAQILSKDPLVDSESVKVEARLKGHHGLWRKPDVQAWLPTANTHVAFEVQVSKELPLAIASRQYFYRLTHGLAIIWVLPEFKPELLSQSQRDIQTQNSDHLFALPEKCIEASRTSGSLQLECWLHKPYRNGNAVSFAWERKTITLDQITFKDGGPIVEDLQAHESSIRAQIEKDKPRLRTTTPTDPTEKLKPQVLNQPDHFDRRWRNLVWRISCLQDDVMWPYLISEISSMPAFEQCQTISGIWLRSRGINLAQTSIPPFVLKALRSASLDRSVWEKQRWSWITNEMIKECNRRWIGPFHNLLNQSGRSSIITSRKYREVIADTRQTRVILSEKEKIFIRSICPNLNLPAPKIMNTLWDGPNLGYPVYEVDSEDEPYLLTPDFMIKAPLDAAEHVEMQITSLVKERLAYGKAIPMPMMPLEITKPKFYACSYMARDREAMLEQWWYQLNQIEQKFMLL